MRDHLVWWWSVVLPARLRWSRDGLRRFGLRLRGRCVECRLRGGHKMRCSRRGHTQTVLPMRWERRDDD